MRPYPLGTLPTPPQIDEVPCLDEALRHGTATGDRQQFEKAKEKIAKLWSKQRISSMPSDTKSSHRVLEPFLQRVKSLMQTRHQIAKRGDLHFEDPMQLEDLLAAYYYRAVQIALFIHKHLLGYCKHRVDDPCRFHLPRTEVCTTQHLNEETDRVEPLCRYLPDDRNVKVHILSIVLRTLCNIQTNVHHPDAACHGLNYSIAYQMKGEPKMKVTLTAATEHPAIQFLECQFVSYFTAATFCLGNQITKSTCQVVLAVPGTVPWEGNANWKNYLQVAACRDNEGKLPVCRDADDRVILEEDLAEALCMARFEQVARYLTLYSATGDAEDDENDDVNGESQPPNAAQQKKAAPVISARTWDAGYDDHSHPAFDPVLSRLLPTTCFHIELQNRVQLIRRRRNKDLAFARFIWPMPTMKPDAAGVTERSKHFQIRLFARLNWHVAPDAMKTRSGIWDRHQLCTLLPEGIDIDTRRVDAYLARGGVLAQEGQLDENDKRERERYLFYRFSQKLSVREGSEPRDASIIEYTKETAVHHSEAICKALDESFSSGESSCECCTKQRLAQLHGQAPTCERCANSVGWHICPMMRCSLCDEPARPRTGDGINEKKMQNVE